MGLFMIELVASLLLSDFPSGSSITYYENKLYLIGDDAKEILILDTNYQIQDTILIHDYSKKRIPKKVKLDYESSIVISEEGKNYLLALGSSSRKNREKGILISLDLKNSDFKKQTHPEIDLSHFIKHVESKKIGEINIEGSTIIGNHILLSNRANAANNKNILIITSTNFWKNPEDLPIQIVHIFLPINSNYSLGVSELCYVKEKDLLLLTLSSEETDNAYDDGAIGDSYIGWMGNISAKLKDASITLDGMLRLAEFDKAFEQEKIEGIAVESFEQEKILLHLISDNDDGQSRLFKISLVLPKL